MGTPEHQRAEVPDSRVCAAARYRLGACAAERIAPGDLADRRCLARRHARGLMSRHARSSMAHPTFITLGPKGTCHENALLHYLEFQGIEDFELVLVEDLLGAIERVRDEPNTFLVQCSAHVQVHLVTERYYQEVFVIDTFLYPTKELSLLVRTDVQRPAESRHRLGHARLPRPRLASG